MTREPATANWFGDGPAPWERFPGVSLRLDATWSGERGRWESPCGKYWFDADAAQRVIDFFPSYLKLTKGEHAGKPFELLDYHRDLIVRIVFGWKRVGDGTRRFRKVFHEIGKKNSKSTLASGLGLYLAFGDGEPGAEVYAAAGDRDQARIVFGESATMARESGEFLHDAGVMVLKNAIVQPATNSTYKALSSTVGTKHGLNVHGLVIDEFHGQRSRDLYDTLAKGTSARRQPLTVLITTAGDDRESICYEEYTYAKNVLAGVIVDEQYLPVIFEASPSDDWTLESTWRKANPGLGVTKKPEYMENECAAALAEPRKRNSFLRLELSIWTESRTAWIAPESWEACRAPAPVEELAALDAVIGLDLSTRVDLTAVVVAFKRPDVAAPETGEKPEPEKIEVTDGSVPARAASKKDLLIDYGVDVVPYFFMPEGVLAERVKKDRIPYDLWRDQGWLRVTPGEVTDTVEVYRFIAEDLRKRFPKIREIAYDDWHAQDIASKLLSDGSVAVPVRQGFRSMSAPSMLFEALVRSKRLRHDGNPVMRWCVSNAEVATDPAGNIKPRKPGADARSTRRIDGVVGLITALARLMVLPRAMVYQGNALPVIEW